MTTSLRVTLRQRIAPDEAHYGGNLVSGAKILELFGDAATELLIRHDGNEGLFRAYEMIEFLAPVHGGDFIEIHASLVKVGKSSRKIEFKAYQVIEASRDVARPEAASIVDPPLLVAQATGTCVVK